MSVLEKVLDLIDANKISSTEVADVLGKTGQIKGVHSLNRGQFKVGEV